MANRFITILRQSGGQVLLKGGLIIGAFVAIGLLAKAIDFEGTFKALAFSSAPETPWYRGIVGFTVFSAVAISASCPRQVVSFLAAYFFGLWAGIATALAGTVLACIFTFFIARIFEEYFRDLVRGKLDIALRFWRDNTFLATVIWRFMPVGSNLLTNLAAGAFGVPAIAFFVGSAIGYIPQTVVFAFVGSGVKVESGVQIGVSILLFAISALLGLAVYARYRKKISAGGIAEAPRRQD